MPGSLKPLANLVGEVIFVDTGSNDSSVEIADQCGAKVIKTEWKDDFSAARNVYLQHASLPWILVLDADEILFPEDLLSFSGQCTNGGKAGFWFTVRHYCKNTGRPNWNYCKPDKRLTDCITGYKTTRNVKLFPNIPGLSYRYPVHESILPGLIERNIPMKESDVPIHHLGYLDLDKSSVTKRVRRNMALGLKKIKEYPNDTCGYLELADLLIEHDNSEAAIKLLKKALSLSPNYLEAYLKLAEAYENTDNIEEAKKIYVRLYNAEPDNFFVNAAIGRLHYEEGKFNDAETYLTKADDYFSIVRLAFSLFHQKKYEDAIKSAAKSLEIYPDGYEGKIIYKRIEMELKGKTAKVK